MHSRDSVYAARDRAHDAPPGTDARRLQIIGNIPHAGERHLRLNWVHKGREVVKEKRNREIEQLTRRGPGIGETVTILTEEEVRKRETDLPKGRIAPPPVDRDKTEVDRTQIDYRSKIDKYER